MRAVFSVGLVSTFLPSGILLRPQDTLRPSAPTAEESRILALENAWGPRFGFPAMIAG
jgi:hypothetical protein